MEVTTRQIVHGYNALQTIGGYSTPININDTEKNTNYTSSCNVLCGLQ